MLSRVLTSQFEGALAMLNECIRACPPDQWESPIAKYPFWQVAYHTLCFVDLYLEANEEHWRPREAFHPRGMDELNEEYPSRKFSQQELIDYLALCLQRVRDVLGAETTATLEGPSGVSRLRFSRMELHIYNIRHIQHHAGQMGALLRRAGVETRWVGSGWR